MQKIHLVESCKSYRISPMTSSTTAVTLQKVAQCKQDSEIPNQMCRLCATSFFTFQTAQIVRKLRCTNLAVYKYVPSNSQDAAFQMFTITICVCVPSTCQDAVFLFFFFFVMVHISHLISDHILLQFNICKIDWIIVIFVFDNYVYSVQWFMTLTTSNVQLNICKIDFVIAICVCMGMLLLHHGD